MIAFSPVTELNSAEVQQSAALVYDSLPALYDLLPLPPADRLSVLADQFSVKGSEIEHTIAAHDSSGVVGIYSFLPALQLRVAQLVGMRHLLFCIPAHQHESFRESVKALLSSIPSVPDDSLYLSRFCVAEERRGAGLAAVMLGKFMTAEPGLDGYSLHVHADNSRAIRFYQKHGFAHFGRRGGTYFAFYAARGAGSTRIKKA